MLRPIPRLVMVPQEVPRPVRIRGHPCNRVEFMITENASARTGLHHPSHEADGLELIWSAVDQITDEHGGTLVVTPNAGRLRIAEHVQKGGELLEFAVD